jgi:hypothetical protein
MGTNLPFTVNPLMPEVSERPFGTGVLHLNFSTPCMENVNNTGTKKKVAL